MNSSDRTGLIWSEDFRRHDTGSHPESPERIGALERALQSAGMFASRPVYAPEPAPLDAVNAVHSEALVERVRRTAESGGAWMDPDTFVSEESFEIALLAAGGAMRAVDLVMTGEVPRAFALVRPPGHHAEPNRAMGFCLFNSVAVAARHAVARHGLERVAIIDWDVHHGNGTQAVFWEDPSVLFVSLHQYPFYPGTGARYERGEGRGEGYTVNVPLPAGSDNNMYEAAFRDIVEPAVVAFEPQLMMVSAGFDAHRDDPLAQMQLSTGSFGVMASSVLSLAEAWCDGKLVLILEGGYNLRALGESVVEVLTTLDGDSRSRSVDR
ncbi:MAG TPA: histone deacetylase [Thermomicrobiales bacterium]|nr:histone deacetylase [Thermomicrobiales bacterium]